jgi:hypothetical protein
MDNIKMDLLEIGVNVVDWVGLAQDRYRLSVKYELGFYIPEDDILHSHRREDLKSYIALTG